MNINQLNQNEYLQQEKSAVDGVEKFADDRIWTLTPDEQRLVVEEVSNGLIAVNSEEQQLVAEKATVKPTTAEWNKVAKRDLTQVEKTQLWTGLNTEVETWVDVA